MAHGSIRIRIADMKATKLLMFTLAELEAEMRLGPPQLRPYAERLEQALHRYAHSKADPESGSGSALDEPPGSDTL